MNKPKSPRWTAMNNTAGKGSSTENSKPKYSAKCERFGQRTLCLLLEEKADAVSMQAERLQKREGNYQDGLVFHNEPREPSLVEGLLFFEGEQRDLYVGVDIYLVRVSVMLVVLVDPPLATYAEQQVAEDESEILILPGGAEGELPVPTVVGEKADLDKDEGQIGGVQELEPGVV